MAKRERRLVVDADVARACGPPSSANPRPWRCLRLLHTAREICHHVLMTPAIRSEWSQHRSQSFSEWLDSMFARKKVHKADPAEDVSLRSKIRHATGGDKVFEELEKDVHLIEAAMATDLTVISCDEKARKRLQRLAGQIGELKGIVWVNPDSVDPDEIESWLRAGARPRKRLMLGYRPE